MDILGMRAGTLTFFLSMMIQLLIVLFSYGVNGYPWHGYGFNGFPNIGSPTYSINNETIDPLLLSSLGLYGGSRFPSYGYSGLPSYGFPGYGVLGQGLTINNNTMNPFLLSSLGLYGGGGGLSGFPGYMGYEPYSHYGSQNYRHGLHHYGGATSNHNVGIVRNYKRTLGNRLHNSGYGSRHYTGVTNNHNMNAIRKYQLNLGNRRVRNSGHGLRHLVY